MAERKIKNILLKNVETGISYASSNTTLFKFTDPLHPVQDKKIRENA